MFILYALSAITTILFVAQAFFSIQEQDALGPSLTRPMAVGQDAVSAHRFAVEYESTVSNTRNRNLDASYAIALRYWSEGAISSRAIVVADPDSTAANAYYILTWVDAESYSPPEVNRIASRMAGLAGVMEASGRMEDGQTHFGSLPLAGAPGIEPGDPYILTDLIRLSQPGV